MQAALGDASFIIVSHVSTGIVTAVDALGNVVWSLESEAVWHTTNLVRSAAATVSSACVEF